MRKYHIYKYVVDDEIVYIGKSKTLDARIRQHSYEEDFKPYLKNCKIFCFECANSVEMDLLEMGLINQYKPILNVVDKHDGFSGRITIQEPDWEEYIIQEKETKKEVHKRTTNKWLSVIRSNDKAIEAYKYIVKMLQDGHYEPTEDDVFGTKVEIPCSKEMCDSGVVGIFLPFRWFKGNGCCGVNLPCSLKYDRKKGKYSYIVGIDFINNEFTKMFVSLIGEHEKMKRMNMLERQREGIAIAKAKGVYKGRKPVEVDDEVFKVQYERYMRREITKTELAKELNISRTTLYKMLNENGVTVASNEAKREETPQ